MTVEQPAPSAVVRDVAPHRHPPLLGIGLIALSAVSFGIMPVVTKLVYDDGASAIGLLSVRFPVAGVVLLALARWRGQALPRGRTLVALCGLGAVGYAGQSLGYFFALDHAGAGVVALLLYTYPAMVVGISAVLRRRVPAPPTLVCLALAVAGTTLTSGRARDADVQGILLALASAVAYATYIVVSDRVIPGVGALIASAVVMCSGAVTFDVLAVLTRPTFPHHARGWLGIALVTLVCTVVAVTAFFGGLARVGAAQASIVSTLEPVVSVALGVSVLGEAFSPVQGIGAVLVLAAVAMLATRRTA